MDYSTAYAVVRWSVPEMLAWAIVTISAVAGTVVAAAAADTVFAGTDADGGMIVLERLGHLCSSSGLAGIDFESSWSC